MCTCQKMHVGHTVRSPAPAVTLTSFQSCASSTFLCFSDTLRHPAALGLSSPTPRHKAATVAPHPHRDREAGDVRRGLCLLRGKGHCDLSCSPLTCRRDVSGVSSFGAVQRLMHEKSCIFMFMFGLRLNGEIPPVVVLGTV